MNYYLVKKILKQSIQIIQILFLDWIFNFKIKILNLIIIQIQLKKNYFKIKEDLKEKNRELNSKIALLQDSSRREIAKVNKERSRLLKKIRELNDSLIKYRDYKIKSENSLDEVKKDALEKRNKELDKLNHEYIL